MPTIEPFRIAIPDADIDDLRARLRQTRWPDAVEGGGWDYGTDPDYLRDLCGYWADGFDWRRQEAVLNALPQYRAEIEGYGIHFVRLGEGEGKPPLMLLHGWPGSFWQMTRIIPLLEDDFELIVPSLIGYGFSDRATAPGHSIGETAKLYLKLLDALGIERVSIRAGDMGAGVARNMAVLAPERVAGLHLTGLFPDSFEAPGDATDAEKDYFARVGQWAQAEGAYAMLQATKPQTVSYALNDSPAGLAAWIVEKFRGWSDSDGEVERRFPRDELLTNIAIYWFTRTAGSAARLYKESMGRPTPASGKRVAAPTAFAQTPRDIVPGPRSIGERDYNVVRWTELPSGGHFAEWEEPGLIADDLRAFFIDQGVLAREREAEPAE